MRLYFTDFDALYSVDSQWQSRFVALSRWLIKYWCCWKSYQTRLLPKTATNVHSQIDWSSYTRRWMTRNWIPFCTILRRCNNIRFIDDSSGWTCDVDDFASSIDFVTHFWKASLIFSFPLKVIKKGNYFTTFCNILSVHLSFDSGAHRVAVNWFHKLSHCTTNESRENAW